MKEYNNIKNDISNIYTINTIVVIITITKKLKTSAVYQDINTMLLSLEVYKIINRNKSR